MKATVPMEDPIPSIGSMAPVVSLQSVVRLIGLQVLPLSLQSLPLSLQSLPLSLPLLSLGLASLPPVLIPSLLAGLATGAGGLVSALWPRPSAASRAALEGGAAGAMVFVAGVELVELALASGSRWATAAGMLAGAAAVAVLGRWLGHGLEGGWATGPGRPLPSLEDGGARAAAVAVLAVTLHNVPEGLALASAFLAAGEAWATGRIWATSGHWAAGDLWRSTLAGAGSHSGTLLALALGLHNLPEGLVIASAFTRPGARAWRWGRWTAPAIAALCGLSEPAAALVGLWLLPAAGAGGLPVALACASGAMLYVVFEDLVPSAGRRPGWAAAAFVLAFALMSTLDRTLLHG